MVEDGDLDIGGVGVEDASGLDVDLFNQMNNLNINESEVDEENEKEKLDKSNTMSADNPVLSFDRPSAKVCAFIYLKVFIPFFLLQVFNMRCLIFR